MYNRKRAPYTKEEGRQILNRVKNQLILEQAERTRKRVKELNRSVQPKPQASTDATEHPERDTQLLTHSSSSTDEREKDLQLPSWPTSRHMSDLSSNETLDPLENNTSTYAHVATLVDNTPEDWEDIVDFEMKNDKEDVTMESSQENDLALANRLQAEEDTLQKDGSIVIETDKQATPDADNTGAAHNESNNAMTIEQTSNDKAEETNLSNDATMVPQAPASAAAQHTDTSAPVPISTQIFQRLLKKGVIANDQQMNRPRSMAETCRPLEELLINFAEEDKASIGIFNNLI